MVNPAAAGPDGRDRISIDGGDLGCGELLLLLARRIRLLPAGTLVALSTSDGAADIDLPAWCHLTGHTYHGRDPASPRPTHLITLSAPSPTPTCRATVAPPVSEIRP